MDTSPPPTTTDDPAARAPDEAAGIELRRTARFCIPFGEQGLDSPGGFDQPTSNTFAAWPSMATLGAYYAVDVACRGPIDPATGYMASIADIDGAVRSHLVPLVDAAVRGRTPPHPAALLAEGLPGLQASLGGIVRTVTWHLTPFLNITIESSSMSRFTVRQQFSFAASHRLHAPALDDETNRRIFGKCNNHNGHGHNYRVEVAVSMPMPDGAGVAVLGVPALERIVDEHVIERFDHTHLNLDTSDFADLIPSVENIARVCHERLVDPIGGTGARLESVTVWETDKTSCTFSG